MIKQVGKIQKTLKGCRPLSLTSCLGKLCKSIVHEQLVNHCEELNPFGDQQSAVRSDRSTTDNLLTLTEKAKTSFKRKGATAAAFLHVGQAFDSVWHKGIPYKQIQNTPWWITKWTSSFLGNRKINLRYNQAFSKIFTSEAVIPQGSIISPILFSIIHIHNNICIYVYIHTHTYIQ